jgi:hypothetical protein
MMITEMDIETSVYYVHLTRLIAREDYIKHPRIEFVTEFPDANGKGDLSCLYEYHVGDVPYPCCILLS